MAHGTAGVWTLAPHKCSELHPPVGSYRCHQQKELFSFSSNLWEHYRVSSPPLTIHRGYTTVYVLQARRMCPIHTTHSCHPWTPGVTWNSRCLEPNPASSFLVYLYLLSLRRPRYRPFLCLLFRLTPKLNPKHVPDACMCRSWDQTCPTMCRYWPWDCSAQKN